MRTTWKPHEKHGRLTKQSDLPDSVYAFPKERKEPLTDARHVRNAVARFDQVTGVPEADRKLAFANIKKAAAHYGIELSEDSADDLGVHPQRNRSAAAKRGAATRKKTAGSLKKTTTARKKTTTARKKTTTARKKSSTGSRKKTGTTGKKTAASRKKRSSAR
jgi:phage-related protein